jgi:hypothetical protein
MKTSTSHVGSFTILFRFLLDISKSLIAGRSMFKNSRFSSVSDISIV